MTDGFDVDVEGDDILEQLTDFGDDFENNLNQVAREMARFFKGKIQREIANRAPGDSVNIGHSSTVRIEELEPSTVSYKSSQSESGDPNKPLVFTSTMYNSVEVRQQGNADFKVGIFSKRTTNGLAVRDYGVIQEYGYPANNVPPRPFIRPALFGNARRIERKLESLTDMDVNLMRVN